MKNKTKDEVFLKGNKIDGKHYWLTPQEVKDKIYETTGIPFDRFFDPCPHPRPDGFDGLTIPWQKYNYVNPPFGVVDEKGKKIGATAWFKKAKLEVEKGTLVVFVFPVHNWSLEMMIFCDATVFHLGNVKWLATEDGKPGKGCGSIAMFVMGFYNIPLSITLWKFFKYLFNMK